MDDGGWADSGTLCPSVMMMMGDGGVLPQKEKKDSQHAGSRRERECTGNRSEKEMEYDGLDYEAGDDKQTEYCERRWGESRKRGMRSVSEDEIS